MPTPRNLTVDPLSLLETPLPDPTPYVGGTDRIKVGLVGCGGRGSGAARDCTSSAEGVELVAIGDMFMDRIEERHDALKEAVGDAYQVPREMMFDGEDAYKKVLDQNVDLVIFATPPGFRPTHVRAAVESGTHTFMEKPSSVDAAGVRSIIETGKMAAEKGISVVAGTQYRRQPSYVEAVKRLHDGMIGDLIGGQAYYLTGELWLRERKPGMTDMEWQCRNWYYFNWLSGDHIVEQFVHNLDALNWIFDAHPESCVATGGRQKRVSPDYGHIFDHFNVDYRYPGDVRVSASCRQMDGCQGDVSNKIIGTKGYAWVNPGSSVIKSWDGETLFEVLERGNNPYVQEHADLVQSIRDNKPLNECEEVAHSTMTGIMGRESAYTGQEVTWDEIMSADLDLYPESFQMGQVPHQPVAVPGVTPLSRTLSRKTVAAMPSSEDKE